ncbi:helix-turn-helix domain-containing protein [Nocardiopsis chromatogenes]|uniref:helix-turn-helix domain-containing protein n=1 Tax=Nocardiopsis chromatogenes TaxID=280239 RepID=UPI00037F5479|nr:helix-turn-helix transcriptional regulator [Nocardiopsis chromatogenes]
MSTDTIPPMGERQSPTVRRRRLARELRKMREAAGMTTAAVTRQLGWAAGRVNHLESGRHGTDPSALRDLMRIYEVTDPERIEAVLALGRQSRQRGWWHTYNDVLDGDYLGFEAEASTISVYQPSVIPGLLQTPEYAARSARASGAVTEKDIERVVAVREKRQEVLVEGIELLAVLDENALMRLVHTSDIAHEQLARLITIAEAVNGITIQVLPVSAGLHAAMGGGFVILDYADAADPSLVYLEGRTGGTFLEKPEELEDYRRVFASLMRSALSEEESIRSIKQFQEEGRRGVS